VPDLGFEHLDPNALVRESRWAQRQLVEIAKAFSHDLKLLILDEGTIGAFGYRTFNESFAVIPANA